MTIRSQDGLSTIGPLGDWERDHRADDGSSSIGLAIVLVALFWWTFPLIILSIPFWNTRAARRLGFWLKRHGA